MPRRPPAPCVGDLAAATRRNTAFRRVLHTGARTQLVAMAVPRGGAVGAERHAHVEQLLVIQSGRARVTLDGHARELGPGGVVVVPPGTRHNVENVGRGALKLFTVYAPPNHLPGRVHATAAAARADAEDEAFGRRVR